MNSYLLNDYLSLLDIQGVDIERVVFDLVFGPNKVLETKC